MSRTVYTKEIMQALEIDSTPMTQDQIFEREQAIEKRWLEQFREHEEKIIQRYEARDGERAAQAKVGQAAQSALHVKGVVIPSLYSNPGTAVDPDAITEVIDATVTYIEMGRDFEIILQAIKENPLLMSEWERFMIALRMASE
jgi:hypothetical protein